MAENWPAVLRASGSSPIDDTSLTDWTMEQSMKLTWVLAKNNALIGANSQ
ncbi:hypothetical protein PMI27_002078 [Pseudomonas sp. GM41(2012)]|jgi:hypothetical protein|nr:hypothetical protein [Pseudomonas sp. GM41(2012)]EUB75902.1 hypothetical protein PMI27_002078 [Pseudomonas sp. GM41(2012)]